MPIEPRDARCETLDAIVPGRRRAREIHRLRVSPRSDHEARSACDIRLCVLPDPYEIGQLAREQWIEPACHQQDRRFQGKCAIAAVDRLPVAVGCGMDDPVVEEADIANRTIVGFDERCTEEAALQLIRG